MAVKLPIYMDNNATTRCDPRVVEAMLPYFTEVYGNAASRNHSFGWQAEEAVEEAREQGTHVIPAVTEHKAVIDPCKRLERDGYQVTFLPVDQYGRVSAQQVAEALTDKTILVSIMAANNEIGT